MKAQDLDGKSAFLFVTFALLGVGIALSGLQLRWMLVIYCSSGIALAASRKSGIVNGQLSSVVWLAWLLGSSLTIAMAPGLASFGSVIILCCVLEGAVCRFLGMGSALTGFSGYWPSSIFFLSVVALGLQILTSSEVGLLPYVTIVSVVYLAVSVKLDRVREAGGAQAVIVGVIIGICIFILEHESTDFCYGCEWQWGGLRLSLGVLLALLAYMSVKFEPMKENDVGGVKFWHALALAAVVIFVFSRIIGIDDPTETRTHVEYSAGLFPLLGSNLIEQGWLDQCGNVPAPSEGRMVGEPGDCWVYQTMWWNIPAHVMALVLIMGGDALLWGRIIALTLKMCSAYLIFSILRISGVEEKGRYIAVIVYLLVPQTAFYGRIYTLQPFSEVGLLLVLRLIIEDWMEPTKSRITKVALLLVPLQLICGWGISAFACMLGLANYHMSTRTERQRLLFASLTLSAGLLSLVIWSVFLNQVSPQGSGYLLSQASHRSQVSGYLLDIGYYQRILAAQGVLLGPILISAPVIGLMAYFSRGETGLDLMGSMRDRPDFVAGMILIGVGVLHFILFPQSSYFHDYWPYVHVTGLSILLGRVVSEIPEGTSRAIVLTGLLVMCKDWWHFEQNEQSQIYTPLTEFHGVQLWLDGNVEGGDVVLIDNELYFRHYITWLSGREMIHLSVETDKDVIGLVTEYQVEHIAVTQNAYWNWGLDELVAEGHWCDERVSEEGSDTEIYALTKC